MVAIREVTRHDLHEGGPASREGTDRHLSRDRRSPRGPSDRLPARQATLSHRHVFGERSVLPTGGPRNIPYAPEGTHPPVGYHPGSCPPPPVRGQHGSAPRGCPLPRRPHLSAARQRISMSVCSVRRNRLGSDALLLAGKGEGRRKKGSLQARCCPSSPLAESPSGVGERAAGPGLAGSAAGQSRTPGSRANRMAGQLGGTPGPRAVRLMKAQQQLGRIAGRCPLCHIPPDRAGSGLAPLWGGGRGGEDKVP